MKIVGIIPVRYNSTRFPGKALALLEGKPMLCHVYAAAASCDMLDSVYVATDSPEIAAVCSTFGFPVIMTKSCHKNPTSRVGEAAARVDASLYVMIGGDEPLITGENIKLTVETAVRMGKAAAPLNNPSIADTFPIVNAVTVIKDYDEISDPSNIKMIATETNELLYATRSPLPYSKQPHTVTYRKFVSIGVYTKEALDFFASVPQSLLEQAEEFDLLRFIEHRKKVMLADIESRTLSVDTPEDLERVKHIIKRRTYEQYSSTI